MYLLVRVSKLLSYNVLTYWHAACAVLSCLGVISSSPQTARLYISQ